MRSTLAPGQRPAPLLSEPTWRGEAGCHRDNSVFFFPPPHFERKQEKDAREGVARALCRTCPVQRECLEHSLATQEPHGIWGGLNELERRRLLRKRAAPAAGGGTGTGTSATTGTATGTATA